MSTQLKISFQSYRSLITSSFALSIADASIDARYICVVEIESCPNASDMTFTGMFLFLAIVAQECRVTYVVRGIRISAIVAIIFNALLVCRSAVSYCLRSFLPGLVMMGNR